MSTVWLTSSAVSRRGQGIHWIWNWLFPAWGSCFCLLYFPASKKWKTSILLLSLVCYKNESILVFLAWLAQAIVNIYWHISIGEFYSIRPKCHKCGMGRPDVTTLLYIFKLVNIKYQIIYKSFQSLFK